MAKLGTWPQDRYTLSWMTQRLANRAPEHTYARKSATSMLQQMLNPMGQELQEINQQLTEERNNMFLTSCNIDLLTEMSYLELGVGMEFQTVTDPDGRFLYTPPTVYGTISGTEYELTIAKDNNIENLAYKALPSRISDGETTLAYQEVIARDSVSTLSETTPNSITLEGHLYISIFNNTTWEYRGIGMIYYPKIYIKGRTRKGTDITEAVPLRYNGTFKTVNQWHSVEDVFISYVDDTAEIAIECLPFAQESALDIQNLIIPSDGIESLRFVKINQRAWGSSVISEGFTAATLEDIQKGFDAKETEYEIELHDSAGQNVSLNAIAIRDTSPYMLAIDDDNLYVYNTVCPYPDATLLMGESTDTKMSLLSSRWAYARDEIAAVNTDILDVSNVPWEHRWHLLDPEGNEWYLGRDGSKWPIGTDAWIANEKWEDGMWDEQVLEFILDLTGTYILSIECKYNSSEGVDERTLITRHLLYVPVIKPEQTLTLPDALKNSTELLFDSDGKLWLKDASDDIKLLNLFYDYYIVDYEANTVWFREDYTEARVVI